MSSVSWSEHNVQGEQQQKLDVISNEIIKSCLGSRANIGALVSEEDETPTVLRSHEDGGRYAVLFDPLDGSSNLDVSVGVGTIFSIVRLGDGVKGTPENMILTPESKQVAAGYVSSMDHPLSSSSQPDRASTCSCWITRSAPLFSSSEIS